LIDKFGKGKEYKITSTSGFKKIDEAIIEVFKRLRFIPAIRDGKPQESWKEFEVKLPINQNEIQEIEPVK